MEKPLVYISFISCPGGYFIEYWTSKPSPSVNQDNQVVGWCGPDNITFREELKKILGDVDEREMKEAIVKCCIDDGLQAGIIGLSEEDWKKLITIAKGIKSQEPPIKEQIKEEINKINLSMAKINKLMEQL